MTVTAPNPSDSRSGVGAPTGTRLTRAGHVWHTIAGAGFAIQATTGLGGKYIAGEVSGWLLFVHMLGAPLFVIGLTATTLMWAERCRFTDRPPGPGLTFGQKLMFWIAVGLGFVVMMSMLTAICPVFGYAGQQALTDIHEFSALLLVAAVITHAFVSLAARGQRGEKR